MSFLDFPVHEKINQIYSNVICNYVVGVKFLQNKILDWYFILKYNKHASQYTCIEKQCQFVFKIKKYAYFTHMLIYFLSYN